MCTPTSCHASRRNQPIFSSGVADLSLGALDPEILDGIDSGKSTLRSGACCVGCGGKLPSHSPPKCRDQDSSIRRRHQERPDVRSSLLLVQAGTFTLVAYETHRRSAPLRTTLGTMDRTLTTGPDVIFWLPRQADHHLTIMRHSKHHLGYHETPSRVPISWDIFNSADPPLPPLQETTFFFSFHLFGFNFFFILFLFFTHIIFPSLHGFIWNIRNKYNLYDPCGQ